MAKKKDTAKIDQDRIDKLTKHLDEMILILDRPCDLKALEKTVEMWLLRAKILRNEN